MKAWQFLAPAIIFFCITHTVAAQPFQFQVLNNGNVTQTSNGSTLALQAPALGSAAQVSISVVYLGSLSARILSTDLVGVSDFTLQQTGTPSLTPGADYTFTILYQATTSALRQAILRVTYQENNTTPQVNTFGLSLTGSAPELSVSYSLSTDKSYVNLTNGVHVDLPVIPPGNASSTTIAISNIGSAPGVIRAATISGAIFSLLGRPILPATLAAGQSLSFAIQSSPTGAGVYTGSLQIDASGGPYVYSFTQVSNATGPSYAIVTASGVSSVLSGATLTFPSTAEGSQASLLFRVTNQTGAAISLTGISLNGAVDFQLANAIQLPISLPTGGSLDLSLVFRPAHVQSLTSTLKIGDDSFNLVGIGLASALAFSYVSQNGEVGVDPNSTILLPSTAIGAPSPVDFIIRNLASQSVQINQAVIAEAKSPFTVINSPLPATLAPQQAIHLPLVFSPLTTGFLTATLVIDSNIFNLKAAALAPKNLPAITLSGPQGPFSALQQVAIAAGLQQPYPVDLAGTLTTAFDNAAQAADPAIQFSTGGHSINFTITAGSLAAKFANGAAVAYLQTGSVGGRIRLMVTIQTMANFDLTGSPQPELDLPIPLTVPSILGVSLASNSGSYQLQILGVTTDRNLKELDLQFVPTGKLNFSSTSITLDLTTAAASWFRDSTSLQFGGLFTLSVPIALNLPANSTAPLTLQDVVRSIACKAISDLGASQVYTVTLQ